MPSRNQRDPLTYHVILAGLEVGTLAGLAMLAWLAIYTWIRNGSVWLVPNLMASTFYGERALVQGFRASTLSGLAVELAAGGALGMLFGLAVGYYPNRLRVLVYALAAAVAWYYISYGVFWRAVNPLVPLYSPSRPMLVGHLLFGLVLGSFPHHLRVLAKTLQRELPQEQSSPE